MPKQLPHSRPNSTPSETSFRPGFFFIVFYVSIFFRIYNLLFVSDFVLRISNFSLMSLKKTTQDLIGERPTPEELKKLPRTPITVLVDNVRSLDNVGMIFRLCELSRVDHLYLTGYTGYPEETGDQRPPQIITRHSHRITKTAVYAVPHQPWSHVEDPLPLVNHLKEQGHQIVCLEQTKDSVPYHQVPNATYHLPLVLIIGHERLGIRDELINLADLSIEIPILGIGNSHNVATACAIVLYHILAKTAKI